MKRKPKKKYNPNFIDDLSEFTDAPDSYQPDSKVVKYSKEN